MRFGTCPKKGASFLLNLGALWVLLFPLGVLAQVRTEMKLFSDSYMSPDFEATEKTNYQFFGAQLKTDPLTQDSVQMDISGGVAMGAPLLNYLNISEIYLHTRQGDSESFYFGRKKMLWSELDARWDLGVWEPLFKWNPLAPEHQGLTGIFWQADKSYFTMTLFASPFYIPDQGPSFEIENGRFVRGNPWFRRPPESIRIWKEATDIDYRFDRPNESQIIFQKSFGAKINFGKSEGWRLQGSYTYKPANQLAIGYDGNLDVSTLKGVVALQPQVFYHSLSGLDMSYREGAWRWGVSGVYDRPDKENNFAEKWTHPVFEDSLLVSSFVDWNRNGWGVSVQYLEIYGGTVREEGELASSDHAPLSLRYPFQQAAQLSLMSNHSFARNQRMTNKITYLVSQKNDFGLVRLSSRYQLSGLWSFVGEMQLLKAGSTSLMNQNDIAQFVNNDRFMLGAAYVF